MDDDTLLDDLTVGEVLQERQLSDAGLDSASKVADYEGLITVEVEKLFGRGTKVDAGDYAGISISCN
jgi:hypothetical protein